jgi:tripartite-type tricarboxylate transporter receptor subunit TctC
MKQNVLKSRRTAVWMAGFVAAGLVGAPAQAADFYAGKTIELIIGGDVGGGYDIYARTLARHLPRHIPGSPTIVPKNLPGAGSGRAAAQIASVAPKDGTSIGAIFPGVIVAPLLEARAQSLFDPTKLTYLASADSGTRICATFHTSKIKTFEDAQKNKGIFGASAAGGSTRDYAAFLKKLVGMQAEIVSGYKGTADLMLAMERGEVDGLCGLDWSSAKSQKPDWLRDKKLNILIQMGVEADPELTQMGVPDVWKFVKDEETRQVIELIVAQQIFGRPYIAPPGAAPEQVKTLRAAFMATMQDKQFLEEAEKARIDIAPSSGEKVQDVVLKLYAAPKHIVDKAKDAIQP